MYDNMNRTIEYIEINLQNIISLDDLSKFTNYSRTHLSRMFNKVVGCSVTDYINRRRLAKASVMLKKNSKSIEYISDIFQYSSSKYFSTLFKKEYGISPSMYKKNNIYIYNYPKRIIKGGKGMDIRNDNELIDYILQNSSTQDDLLDTLSSLDNIVMYDQKNSLVHLIAVIEVQKEVMTDVLVQLELNLISGKQYIRPIFTTVNSPGVNITSVYKEEDGFKVVFGKENKSIIADCFPTGDTDFEVMVHTEINDVFGYGLDEEFPKSHIDVQKFSEKLLNVKSNLELEQIIEKEKHLLKLRSFIHEYALIYMTYTDKTLALFSIYLDLEEKRYRQINVFTTPNLYKNLKFKKTGQNAGIYDGEKILARAEIYTRDLSPTYALSFPNGSSGTGAWNLTNMFDNAQ